MQQYAWISSYKFVTRKESKSRLNPYAVVNISEPSLSDPSPFLRYLKKMISYHDIVLTYTALLGSSSPTKLGNFCSLPSCRPHYKSNSPTSSSFVEPHKPRSMGF